MGTMRNLFIALGAFIAIYASKDDTKKVELKNDLDKDNNNNLCYIQYLECMDSGDNNKNKKNRLKKDSTSNNNNKKKEENKSYNKKEKKEIVNMKDIQFLRG